MDEKDSTKFQLFDLVDELAMLLTAVVEAAAKTGTKDVREILASDKRAQAHFASFSVHLKEKTGQEATLFEYAKTVDGQRTKAIMSGDTNNAGWPVWNRIL